MLIEHLGNRPRIDPSAYVAPNAVVSGDVVVGAESRVLFGAVLTSEGGPVELGRQAIVMEGALIRGREGHPARIGDNVIVGPNAHVNGAVVEENAFIATGASIFPGARVGAGAEVRIGGVVHVNTRLLRDGLVPIGWIAVGDPAEVFSPDQLERIWEIQEGLDFPRTMFGLPRGPAAEMMSEATRRYAQTFGRHRDDRVID